MLEVLIISSVILIVTAAAAYFYASAREKSALNALQAEIIANLRTEMRDWQNKALYRQGQTVLGQETAKKAENSTTEPEVTPRIVHRGQLESREAQLDAPIQPTIHVNSVSYDRLARKDVLNKAAEIINVNRP